jgi:YD repeat-containing protein
LKNGDFYISYTDIVYSGGFEPKIERVYNSKTSFNGIFGFGWGTDFEVYLEIHPEGAIIVHEYGGGASKVFVPAGAKPLDLASAVDQIVAAARQNHDMASPSAIQAYGDRLISDIDFRAREWDKYLKLGLVKPIKVPVGARFVSDRQEIMRTPLGYERTFDSGRKESFDERGRLTRILDPNGNYVQFGYGVRNRIQIVDNYGRHITIFLNDRKLVERVEGDDGVASTYSYDEHNNLTYNKDVDNHVFRYDYDPRHNMTKISYEDGTTMEVSYYPRERYENVRSVKDRDGTVANYDYWIDLADRGHYCITVVADTSNHTISKSTYEYFNKRSASGVEYTSRLVSNIDGEVTDTRYNEAGVPIFISRGDEKTAGHANVEDASGSTNEEEAKLEYDSNGHVTRKETPTDITDLEYDPRANKVSYVRRTSKADPKDTTWSRYKYDDKGNLAEATNDSGLAVHLNYDGLGRISELRRGGGTSITFRYNRISKPVEICAIESQKMDCIEVTYTDSGKTKDVKSTSGRQVALKVTSAFQELQDLIRPAGVDLSF